MQGTFHIFRKTSLYNASHVIYALKHLTVLNPLIAFCSALGKQSEISNYIFSAITPWSPLQALPVEAPLHFSVQPLPLHIL
jgi:hypothetical protein